MIELICLECGSLFYRYPSYIKIGRSKFCSVKCKAEWQKTHLKGDNNPNYGNHPIPWNKGKTKEADSRVLAYVLKLRGRKRSKKAVEKMRNALKGRDVWNRGKKGIYPKESRKKMSIRAKERLSDPQNHPNWQGGKSFEPYGLDFNDELKEKIKERDNYVCRLCGARGRDIKLDVHHIDYNKNNNEESNLVTLCVSCHMETNYHREKWIARLRSQVD